LRGEEENYVDVTKDSGTWPTIAGVRKKGRRGLLLLKIDLKY